MIAEKSVGHEISLLGSIQHYLKLFWHKSKIKSKPCLAQLLPTIVF